MGVEINQPGNDQPALNRVHFRAVGTKDNKGLSDEILEATRRELLDAGNE